MPAVLVQLQAVLEFRQSPALVAQFAVRAAAYLADTAPTHLAAPDAEFDLVAVAESHVVAQYDQYFWSIVHSAPTSVAFAVAAFRLAHGIVQIVEPLVDAELSNRPIVESDLDYCFLGAVIAQQIHLAVLAAFPVVTLIAVNVLWFELFAFQAPPNLPNFVQINPAFAPASFSTQTVSFPPVAIRFVMAWTVE